MSRVLSVFFGLCFWTLSFHLDFLTLAWLTVSLVSVLCYWVFGLYKLCLLPAFWPFALLTCTNVTCIKSILIWIHACATLPDACNPEQYDYKYKTQCNLWIPFFWYIYPVTDGKQIFTKVHGKTITLSAPSHLIASSSQPLQFITTFVFSWNSPALCPSDR